VRAIFIAAMAASCGAAHAGVNIVSFDYSDLAGSFEGSTFSLAGDANSNGDVTRTQSGETAEFGEGSLTGATAGVSVDLAISNITASTAEGNGTLTLTDADGDTLTADVDGDFAVDALNAVSFQGLLTNVALSSGSTFDGTDGGSFSTDFPGFITPFDGEVVSIFFGADEFFDAAFSVQDVGLSGQVQAIPTPASALALAGLGLVMPRRRRN
jgi:hypothetical protein